MTEVVIKIDWLFTEDKFSGEKCLACKECIYGLGYRMVLSTSAAHKPLPFFTETEVIICKACDPKGALLW